MTFAVLDVRPVLPCQNGSDGRNSHSVSGGKVAPADTVCGQGNRETLALPRSARALHQDAAYSRTGAAFDPSNAPQLADFVPAFISDNGSPLLGQGIITMHPEPPTLGVTPPAVDAARGPLCTRILPW